MIRYSIRLCCWMLLLVACAGCSTGSDPLRDLRIRLGIEKPLVHQDVPPAPTLSGFTQQLSMTQATSLRVRFGSNQPEQIISDPRTIQAVIHVLRSSNIAAETPKMSAPATIKITFLVDTPARQVDLRYDSATGSVSIYNTPTHAWPDHAVGQYTVPADFGGRLMAVLQP